MNTLKSFTQSKTFKSQVATSISKSKPRQTNGNVRFGDQSENTFDVTLDSISGDVYLNVGNKVIAFEFDADLETKIHDDDYVEIKAWQVKSVRSSYAFVDCDHEFTCSDEISDLKFSRARQAIDDLIQLNVKNLNLEDALNEARKEYAI